MKLLVIRETLIYFISLYYDYPRGMLGVYSVSLFYFKLIDKDLEAKNSLTDLGLSVFMVVSSAILIWGLCDKIY